MDVPPPGTARPAAARPRLVLVGGAPASGKSTLARHLAAALALPLLPRDRITEQIAEAFDVRSREDMGPVSRASFGVFYALMDEMLGTGSGVVAETNFHRGVSETELRPFLDRAGPVLIFCRVAREVSVRRFEARFERGERHPRAFDAERIAGLRAGLPDPAWERAEPLDLPVPTLVVDTTDGYAPGLEEIVAFARAVG